MSNKAAYIEIVKQHPELPVFAQPWWLDIVCKEWDAAIARKGEHVTGVWAYPVESTIGVAMLRTPKLTPYMGPQVFFPLQIKESNIDSFEHETVADLIKQLPNAPVWDLALQPGMKQAGIFKSNGLNSTVHQTFLLELTDNEETLLSNMKETMRRNIRLAETEITISNDPTHLKELFKFHKHTLQKKKKNVPYSLKDLQKIMNACIANDSAALWVAKDGKKTLAIVWQVWDKKCSYYFMGGQNPDTNSYKAMSLLLWHTIKEAKARGVSTFDLEGSMDEGVERFFRSFGGDRVLYIVLLKNRSLLWRMKKMVLG